MVPSTLNAGTTSSEGRPLHSSSPIKSPMVGSMAAFSAQPKESTAINPSQQMTASLVPSKPSEATLAIRRRRRSFLVFVRILFKCLERAGDKQLTFSARQMIRRCIQLHRNGRKQHASLVVDVEHELKRLVGKNYWVQAKTYLKQYNCWRYKRNQLLADSCFGPKQVDQG